MGLEGTPDLRDLVTMDEVAEITGLPIDRCSRHVGEEWFALGFTSSDPDHHHNIELRAFHGHVDGDQLDPHGTWEFLTDAITDRQPVGIGDEAFCDNYGQIYTLAKGQVLHTVVTVQDGSYPVADVSEKLLRLAVGRI